MKILLRLLKIALILLVNVVAVASCGIESYSGKIIISGSEPNLKFILITETNRYEIVGADSDKLISHQGREVSLKGVIEREPLGPGFPAVLRIEGTPSRNPE